MKFKDLTIFFILVSMFDFISTLIVVDGIKIIELNPNLSFYNFLVGSPLGIILFLLKGFIINLVYFIFFYTVHKFTLSQIKQTKGKQRRLYRLLHIYNKIGYFVLCLYIFSLGVKNISY